MTHVTDLNQATPLLDRLRAGQPDAFAECVRRHHVLVRTYLSRHVGGMATVDRLAEDTFLTAFRRLPGAEERLPLTAWLLGIAHERALEHLRGPARLPPEESSPLDQALQAWQLERAQAQAPEEFEAELSALRNCLQELPPYSREVVQAYYFQQQTVEHLAKRARRSTASVQRMLLRIRHMLNACLQRRLGREDHA